MQRFFRSLGFALNGLLQLIRYERNFQIHVAAFIGVLALGIFFGISSMEWLVIFLISALVMGLEAINTAIEYLCDLYSIETDKRIKKIKDIAAGAVLIAAIFAVCIAVVVFLPYVKRMLWKQSESGEWERLTQIYSNGLFECIPNRGRINRY